MVCREADIGRRQLGDWQHEHSAFVARERGTRSSFLGKMYIKTPLIEMYSVDDDKLFQNYGVVCGCGQKIDAARSGDERDKKLRNFDTNTYTTATKGELKIRYNTLSTQ